MNATTMLVGSLLVFGAEPRPTHTLRLTERGEYEARLQYTVESPNLTATQWWIAFPQAPELPGQRRPNTSLEPAGRLEGEAGRRVWMARYRPRNPAEARQLQVVAILRATLVARELVPLAAKDPVPEVPPLPGGERQRYLKASRTYDFNDRRFQAWLDEQDLRFQANGDVIAFARRVQEAVIGQLAYEYRPDQDRRVASLCGERATDCGGMAFLFVSALRANGIPARAQLGRWALTAPPGERIGNSPNLQQHVRAEFFAPGVGWIPADPAKKRFGSDAGNFLTFHVDPDLEVTGPRGKQNLLFAQGVHYWALGQGTVDGSRHTDLWTVRPLASASKSR